MCMLVVHIYGSVHNNVCTHVSTHNCVLYVCMYVCMYTFCQETTRSSFVRALLTLGVLFSHQIPCILYYLCITNLQSLRFYNLCISLMKQDGCSHLLLRKKKFICHDSCQLGLFPILIILTYLNLNTMCVIITTQFIIKTENTFFLKIKTGITFYTIR